MNNISYIVLRGIGSKAQLEQLQQAGKYIIGLEVIENELQYLLDESIDPQHKDQRTDTSAIDYVFKNFASIVMKAENKEIVFATSKADLDSVGAMAILTMAFEKKATEFNADIANRVEAINKYDNFTGEKWTPKPIEETIQTNVQFGAINTAVIDFKASIEERVKIMEEYLKAGIQPKKYVIQHDQEVEAIKKAIDDGSITVEVQKDIAIVKSNHLKGPQIGYSKAPGVIAYNDKFDPQKTGNLQVKFTICQYPGEKVFDFYKLKSDLNENDPFVKSGNEWGGNPNLLASPMQTGTGLDVDKVIEVVLNGVASEYHAYDSFAF